MLFLYAKISDFFYFLFLMTKIVNDKLEKT